MKCLHELGGLLSAAHSVMDRARVVTSSCELSRSGWDEDLQQSSLSLFRKAEGRVRDQQDSPKVLDERSERPTLEASLGNAQGAETPSMWSTHRYVPWNGNGIQFLNPLVAQRDSGHAVSFGELFQFALNRLFTITLDPSPLPLPFGKGRGSPVASLHTNEQGANTKNCIQIPWKGARSSKLYSFESLRLLLSRIHAVPTTRGLRHPGYFPKTPPASDSTAIQRVESQSIYRRNSWVRGGLLPLERIDLVPELGRRRRLLGVA